MSREPGDLSRLREAYESLRGWSKALAIVVETTWPDVEATLEEKYVLLEGCPSYAAMAGIAFEPVAHKFAEVAAAMEDVAREIREAPPPLRHEPPPGPLGTMFD